VASRLSQIAPIKRFFRAENPHQGQGSDEHNNQKHHDKEDNPLHPGAKRAVVCGENQN